MAILASQNVVSAGLAPTYVAAAAGGDEYTPGATTFVHIKNASAGALTATVVTHATFSGYAVADLAVSIPAAGERMIGPLAADVFRDPATGRGNVTYSGVTSLTIAIVSI